MTNKILSPTKAEKLIALEQLDKIEQIRSRLDVIQELFELPDIEKAIEHMRDLNVLLTRSNLRTINLYHNRHFVKQDEDGNIYFGEIAESDG